MNNESMPWCRWCECYHHTSAPHINKQRVMVGGVELDQKQMFDLLIRYKRDLEGLTPGGSEYVNEPERCKAYVRARIATLHRIISKQKAGVL